MGSLTRTRNVPPLTTRGGDGFRLACGHTVAVEPWTDWLTLIHTPCSACQRDAIRERLEAEAAEPDWHRAERLRASHFDAFTWRLDPPTD